MDFDSELQNKDVFREVISKRDFTQIVIWIDGEWSDVDAPLYRSKYLDGKPVYFLNEEDLIKLYDKEDFLEFLIQKIDELLNNDLLVTKEKSGPINIQSTLLKEY